MDGRGRVPSISKAGERRAFSIRIALVAVSVVIAVGVGGCAGAAGDEDGASPALPVPGETAPAGEASSGAPDAGATSGGEPDDGSAQGGTSAAGDAGGEGSGAAVDPDAGGSDGDDSGDEGAGEDGASDEDSQDGSADEGTGTGDGGTDDDGTGGEDTGGGALGGGLGPLHDLAVLDPVHLEDGPLGPVFHRLPGLLPGQRFSSVLEVVNDSDGPLLVTLELQDGSDLSCVGGCLVQLAPGQTRAIEVAGVAETRDVRVGVRPAALDDSPVGPGDGDVVLPEIGDPLLPPELIG